MTRKTDSRTQLHTAYMNVVANFAVGVEEVAEAVGVERKRANALLHSLQNKNLIDGIHVNGEKALTWQSYYDIENDDREDGMEKAEADFNAAYPADGRKTVSRREGGATGPRYTEAQIKAGLDARKAGLANKAVAEAAGVKSPSYFAKTLKRVEAERATLAKARKIARDAKKQTAKKAPAKRARKSAGGDGPQALKDMLKL